MSDADLYLVWSNQHRRWWGPGARGYMANSRDAGRYTREQALRICADAMPQRRGDEPLYEIPVRLADINAARERFASVYGYIDPEPGAR